MIDNTGCKSSDMIHGYDSYQSQIWKEEIKYNEYHLFNEVRKRCTMIQVKTAFGEKNCLLYRDQGNVITHCDPCQIIAQR